MKLDEVRVVDDATDDFELIKEIISSRDQEGAFYILDIGDVVEKHRAWLSKLPRVKPHFAIKCNPDPRVIKTLATLNAGFDCASEQEIRQVLATGVSGDRIIFANTMKLDSHIKYAREMGVTDMTVDSEDELHKIKKIYPGANIVIRFRCDAAVSETELGSKSSCDAVRDAPKLIRLAKDLGMNVHGFSFHVGTGCGEVMAYDRGIKIALGLINFAESLGFQNVKMIDIGGGFPGDKNSSIDEFAEVINNAVKVVDPSIRIISEPGRYYVGSAFTLPCLLFGKKIIDEEGGRRYMYYVNDGIYGSFICHARTTTIRHPVPLNKPRCEETHLSTIWGPTCDTCDIVVPELWAPEYYIGDWLVWRNMGAYSLCLAGTFNGMPLPSIFPIIRRKVWKSLALNQSCEEMHGIVNVMENIGRISSQLRC